MKIAIVGVGAIGGYLGTRLAHAGNEVTFIARGANLDALRTRGIRLIMGDGSELAVPHVAATDDYGAAGPQDVVVLAMKAALTHLRNPKANIAFTFYTKSPTLGPYRWWSIRRRIALPESLL